MAVTYVIVSGQGFTAKEKLFISLAWLPKSGVQVYLAACLLSIGY